MDVEKYACALILHMFDICLFSDSTTNKVHFRWLPLLEDLDIYGDIFWGSAVLTHPYKE